MNIAKWLIFSIMTIMLVGCATFKTESHYIDISQVVNIEPETIALEVTPLGVNATNVPMVREIELPTPVVPLNERARVVISNEEIRCVADAIYHEARGESDRGKIAVGYTILNRMATKGYPSTACGVVYQKNLVRGVKRCQFSWACTHKVRSKPQEKVYEQAMQVAEAVLTRSVVNPIDDSIFFNVRGIKTNYGRAHNRRATIGGHDFFAAI